ncbi:hypothetical protein [Serinicoccus sp. LYQ131]|uniref:hypothetical protein n=1 Tax=Serinicoccus sp. LYQ131 TaxID=3378797 RepID=UPI0038555BE6
MLALVWFVLDSWSGSRAVAAGLFMGGSLALALSAVPRPGRFGWGAPLLVFSTVALATHRTSVWLSELEQPGSTLGASGTDLIVLLLLTSWLVGFAATTAGVVERH